MLNNTSSYDTVTHVNHQFDNLADETIVHIMSYLNYYSMLQMMAVSKKFNALVKDQSFDQLMFRQKPQKPSKPGDIEFTLHPILRSMNTYRGVLSDLSTATFSLSDNDEPRFKFIDQVQIGQFATSPACYCIKVDYKLFAPHVVIMNLDGVRVIDVLHGIEKMWGKIDARNANFKDQQIGEFDRAKTSFIRGPFTHGQPKRSAKEWSTQLGYKVTKYAEVADTSGLSSSGWQLPIVGRPNLVELNASGWDM